MTLLIATLDKNRMHVSIQCAVGATPQAKQGEPSYLIAFPLPAGLQARDDLNLPILCVEYMCWASSLYFSVMSTSLFGHFQRFCRERSIHNKSQPSHSQPVFVAREHLQALHRHQQRKISFFECIVIEWRGLKKWKRAQRRPFSTSKDGVMSW